MSRSIEPGDVLGGRYKVTSVAEETPAGDLVLEGRDQVLGRRVSVLVAGAENNERLIENSRTVAAGPRVGALQILDLGQTDADLTYLITSHVPAHELLDALLGNGRDPDTESLGGDIFGAEAAPSTAGDYEHVGDGASPAREDAEEPEQGPDATQWSDADYEAFGEESSVRRTGSSARRKGSRETLFDRAASDAAGPTAAASAASARRAERADDGSNAYEPEDDPYDVAPAAVYGDYDDEDAYDEDERRSGPGAGLWITGAVVLLLLGALVFFGFSRLGAMVASVSPSDVSASPSHSASSASATASATPSATASASPKAAKVAGVSRVVTGQNSSFMASQDGTLKLAADGNQSTAWSSFGFSNSSWAGQTQGVGLALQLQDATRLKGLDVSQTSGSGGKYTVYLADKPSIDGAVSAGSGTFSGQTSHVDFSADAQKKDAKYVIVYFTEAPRLSQPIAGYPYGLRINEITLKQ